MQHGTHSISGPKVLQRSCLAFSHCISWLLVVVAVPLLGTTQQQHLASALAQPKQQRPLSMMEGLTFRTVRPTDIPEVAVIEEASYPVDEAASKSSLQYRQHHAAKYFRCAVVVPADGDDDELVVGFVCSTRCRTFDEESMSQHVADGSILAIHSVVVREEYRKRGIATAMMKDYVECMKKTDVNGLMLIAKKHLLAFYVNCGFQVKRPSAIVHGADQWYDLELDLSAQAPSRTAKRTSSRPYHVVDAFSNPQMPGTGNPAAVLLLDEERIDLESEEGINRQWMQMVAAEFNLAETAFVWPSPERKDEKDENERHENELHYSIRYFTPKIEVPLCGHATLASASVLYRSINLVNKKEKVIVFHALNDVLRAELATGNVISMTFPAKPAIEVTDADNEDQEAVEKMLQEALQVPPDAIMFMGISEIGDLLVEISLEAFERLPMDGIRFDALLSWDGYDRGVIVCAAACTEVTQKAESDSDKDDSNNRVPEIDFVSRFFAPKAGINEDPVTGSAHCVLAPYFAKKLEKSTVCGHQRSARGGIVQCTLLPSGEAKADSVRLTGKTTTTMTGSLLL